jgi:hypothetical protein
MDRASFAAATAAPERVREWLGFAEDAVTMLRLERMTKLGRLGEELVAERLSEHGFVDIENLNLRRHNYRFGDLLATESRGSVFHRSKGAQ